MHALRAVLQAIHPLALGLQASNVSWRCEHNLGLTCDPVCGLVQVPCIERNAIGAVKAVNAARLALRGDGTHFVSLDSVIATMNETGHALSAGYRETALAGLATNALTC